MAASFLFYHNKTTQYKISNKAKKKKNTSTNKTKYA